MAQQAPLSSIIVEQLEWPNMEGEISSNNRELAKQKLERENKDKELFGRLDEAAEKYGSGTSKQSNNEEIKAEIPRVPREVSDKYGSEYFKPKTIAIGPIHANCSETTKFQELKVAWASKYLGGLNCKEILKEIRVAVEEDESMDNDDLARMLFVDGCAILQFIYSFVWGDSLKDLDIKECEASAVQQDLFLLENQIPFRVLQIIMNHGPNKEQKEKPKHLLEKEEKRVQGHFWEKLWRIDCEIADEYYQNVTKMEETLKLFIRMSNVAPAPACPTYFFLDDGQDPLEIGGAVHLLDLLRRALLAQDYSSWTSRSWMRKLPVFVIRTLPLYLLKFLVFLTILPLFIFCWFLYSLFKLITEFQCLAMEDLLIIPVALFMICISPTKYLIQKSPITRRSFCSVQDVKQAGIKLKPSKNSRLSDVGFSSGFLAVNGCLKLLPMLVDNSTPYKLLNLVAYEMSLSYNNLSESDNQKEKKNTTTSDPRTYAVTSYLSFLDSLIEDAQDVKDLRAAHILKYYLIDDNDVAELIKKISPSLVPEDMFSNDSAELREYCRRKRPVWAAVFRKMYLSSPWAFLGLVGALIGLILTGISTYFAAFPK